jgi:hypothetical protein
MICRVEPWPEPVSRAFRHANDKIYNLMQGESEFLVTGNLKNWERWDRHLCRWDDQEVYFKAPAWFSAHGLNPKGSVFAETRSAAQWPAAWGPAAAPKGRRAGHMSKSADSMLRLS